MRVCLACDYFFPQLGGVEKHIWELARELVRRGHHVVVLTHQSPPRLKAL